ncbi:hypothetical protein EDD29_0150 [Actinocorallia herbida]|uniref:Uncharacterized protein n=1 Tax=Actinocorallia herbida TaxID=58109 RepID=A0A3N1CP84_9ACTN|nr:hypothetical protein [Actinocorallia herbida]ROO82528.1 hypothetical protein EDD29_0008 [Actinocorallia herbida]ROO82669.1 hypothetical protein EDD29_0150 [Actinocorallia herbida]
MNPRTNRPQDAVPRLGPYLALKARRDLAVWLADEEGVSDDAVRKVLGRIADHLPIDQAVEAFANWREIRVKADALNSGDMDWSEAAPDTIGTDRDLQVAESSTRDADGLLAKLLGEAA